jgi:prolycopene isomerase
MQHNTKKTIGIIGAGIGGLTAGALLTKQGHIVEIYERNPRVGGRALSLDGTTLTLKEYKHLLSQYKMHIPFAEPSLETLFEKRLLDGYTLDFGFHALGGGSASNLRQVFTQLGEAITFHESHVGLIKNKGYDFPFLSRVDKLKILPKVLRLLVASESTMQKFDTVTMTEMIRRYGKGKMKLILEVFSRAITTVNDLDLISTGEMFRSQRNLLQGSKPVGYPLNGLGYISQTLADYIRRNGGTIRCNKSVSEIVIENNCACGVVVDNKIHTFDGVISNMLVQDLFTVAPEHCFPKEYVNHLKQLYGTGSLCAYYSLKKIDPELVGKTFLFIERDAGVKGTDAVGMIDFMTALPTSSLAPSAHHLVQSYIICTPEEARSKKTLPHLRGILDTKLAKLLPDFQEQLRWAIYPATWHLDGVAKTVDNMKPPNQTPVDNLYLVGDCVKSPGIGINCALSSAKQVISLLSKKS